MLDGKCNSEYVLSCEEILSDSYHKYFHLILYIAVENNQLYDFLEYSIYHFLMNGD